MFQLFYIKNNPAILLELERTKLTKENLMIVKRKRQEKFTLSEGMDEDYKR